MSDGSVGVLGCAAHPVMRAWLREVHRAEPVRKRKTHSPSHLICRPTRQYNTRSLTSDAALVEAEDQTERIHSATEPQERASKMDQIARSEPARGLKTEVHRHFAEELYSRTEATTID